MERTVQDAQRSSYLQRCGAGTARIARPGSWIGGTIGPTILDDPAATRFAVDATTPDVLMWNQAFTGHGAFVNTAVLRLLGIDDTAPDPPGGFFVRLPGSNVVSGILHEYAQHWASVQIFTHGPAADRTAQYRKVSQDAARFGITSIQLMATATLDAAARLAEADPGVRWRIIRFPLPQYPTWPLDDISGVDQLTHPRVRVSGLKWFLDGTPVERLAAMRQPYSDRPQTSGRLNFPGAVVREMLEAARRAGEQPMFHAVGDQTIATILDAMEATADDATWRAMRVRIEHGDLLLPDLIDRARRLGVIVVQNPAHFALIQGIAADRWGPERVRHGQPFATLLRSGIPMALGSDTNGLLSPYLDISYAATHPTNPKEAVTVEQAVVAHTSGSAFAEFAEQEKGRLLPGMLADIAVLSQDIFTVPVEQLGQTESVLTLVGGAVVYCNASFCL